MSSTQRQKNVGIAISVGALAVLVVAALLIQQVFVSPVLERERAGLSKSIHLGQMLSVLGNSDEETRSELEAHLKALRDGGEIDALDGTIYTLTPSRSAELIAAANSIESALSERQDTSLSELTDMLVVAHYNIWDGIVKKVKWYRYAVGFNALLLMVFIGLQVYRRLNRTKGVWNEKIQDNKQILDATNDGLFVIKPTLQVGSIQSGALKTLFGINQPIKGDFFDFLKCLVSVDELTATKGYVAQLLDGPSDSSLSPDLNPLQEVKITVDDESGHTVVKYLNFAFSRDQADPDTGVLVSVSDVTKEVQLRRELAASSRENEERISLLMGSIVSDPEKVAEFHESTHVALSEINNLLANDEKNSDNNTQTLEGLSAAVHRFKGAAGAAGVALVETSALRFETKIKELLDQAQASGEPIKSERMLALTPLLKQVISDLDLLEQLNNKLNVKQPDNDLPVAETDVSSSEIGREVEQVAMLAPQEPVCELERVATIVAAEQHKLVKLEKIGFDDFSISAAAEAEINSFCAQLVSNCVIHGIELPQERRDLGKPSEGRILVNLSAQDDQTLLLRVWDDGQGFNFEAIRKTAIERDLVKADIVATMSKGELVRFVFLAGFSTIGQSSALGMGLEAVKTSVSELNGKIRVKSSRGRFSQITIELPASSVLLAEEPAPESRYSS